VRYVSPAYYQSCGEGVDTSTLSTVQLARVIARAESMVDRYCHLPTLAPTTVTDEMCQWNGESRRVFYAMAPVPLTTITGCRIQVSTNPVTGNPLIATVNPNDVAVFARLGYVEIVSFTAMTMGLTPVLLNLGLTNVIAHLDYTAGWTLTDTETLIDSGDHQTYDSVRCLWDPTVPAVVKANGTTVTPTTVNYTDGEVTLATRGTASDVVTAAYTYHIPDQIRTAAVIVTSALVGEHFLQTQGLTNLMTARNGRMYQLQRPQGIDSARIPGAAADILSDYRHISLAAV